MTHSDRAREPKQWAKLTRLQVDPRVRPCHHQAAKGGYAQVEGGYAQVLAHAPQGAGAGLAAVSQWLRGGVGRHD